MTEKRNARKTETGIVESGPANKTIAVKTVVMVKHPKYERYLRRATIFKAHDEKQEAKPGDVVEIMATRPISKTKHWRLVRVVTRRADKGSEVAS